MPPIAPSDLDGIGDPIIVFTFGRSGTHMTIDLIRRHFADFDSWKYPLELNSAVYTWLDRLVQPRTTPRATRQMRRAARPILMTHNWPEMCDRLAVAQPNIAHWLTERGRVIHVVRDPKQAISSAWPIDNERARRAGVPMDSAHAYVSSSACRWARDIEAMLGTSHLRFRYEDIRRDPVQAVERLGEWVGASPRWRTPIMARPHASVSHARLARLLTFRPASSAAIASRAVQKRYRLEWTPGLEAILRAGAGPALSRLGYDNTILYSADHFVPSDRSISVGC
jgi:hypothetical protein